MEDKTKLIGLTTTRLIWPNVISPPSINGLVTSLGAELDVVQDLIREMLAEELEHGGH